MQYNNYNLIGTYKGTNCWLVTLGQYLNDIDRNSHDIFILTDKNNVCVQDNMIMARLVNGRNIVTVTKVPVETYFGIKPKVQEEEEVHIVTERSTVESFAAVGEDKLRELAKVGEKKLDEQVEEGRRVRKRIKRQPGRSRVNRKVA